MRPKNDTERLLAFLDSVEESILSASDEEILEDVRLEGQDPDREANSVRNLINAVVERP